MLGCERNSTYHTECCLLAGVEYQYRCIDTFGDGWHGGHLLIGDDDTHYCHSFDGSQDFGVFEWSPGNGGDDDDDDSDSDGGTNPDVCDTSDDAPVRIRASVVYAALGQENMERAVDAQDPEACHDASTEDM